MFADSIGFSCFTFVVSSLPFYHRHYTFSFLLLLLIFSCVALANFNQLDGLNLFIVECPIVIFHERMVFISYSSSSILTEIVLLIEQFKWLRSFVYRRSKSVAIVPCPLKRATVEPRILCCQHFLYVVG